MRLVEKDIELLQGYAWPGNVRQLFNVLQRYYVLGGRTDLGRLLEEERRMIGAEAASRSGAGLLPDRLCEEDLIGSRQLQREYARLALRACGGNKSHTAEKLGISVNTLSKRLRE
jgi:DNA-binding NtrC family response regulator